MSSAKSPGVKSKSPLGPSMGVVVGADLGCGQFDSISKVQVIFEVVFELLFKSNFEVIFKVSFDFKSFRVL